MSYVYYNPNPLNRHTGDCSVRAISKAMDCSWESAYISLCAEGMDLRDMPSANYVWGQYLLKNGFSQHFVPFVCPSCITVSEFAEEHPEGVYVVATNNHVVCIEDGDLFDSWDSSDEVVLYYFAKEI